MTHPPTPKNKNCFQGVELILLPTPVACFGCSGFTAWVKASYSYRGVCDFLQFVQVTGGTGTAAVFLVPVNS
jgi:hypothetical protein